MHNLFTRAKFGLVPLSLTPPMLISNEQILLSYVKSCGNVTSQYDVNSSIEVFQIAKMFIGSSFKHWLMANYNNASGARAPLCRAITNWLNKKAHGRTVIDAVRRDIDRLNFLHSYEEKLSIPITNNLDKNNYYNNIDFSTIENKDCYAFFLLLGPELTAHFCLSLDGIRYQ